MSGVISVASYTRAIAERDQLRIRAEAAERERDRFEAEKLKLHEAWVKTLADFQAARAREDAALSQLSALKAQLAEAQAYIQFVSDEVDRANVGLKYPRATNPIHTVIGALADVERERDALRQQTEVLRKERDELRGFAQLVEPHMANIAFNNRPHSEEFRMLYDACVEARSFIYAATNQP